MLSDATPLLLVGGDIGGEKVAKFVHSLAL
jgi:hypothetical protein